MLMLCIGDMPSKIKAPHNTVMSGFRIMKLSKYYYWAIDTHGDTDFRLQLDQFPS